MRSSAMLARKLAKLIERMNISLGQVNQRDQNLFGISSAVASKQSSAALVLLINRLLTKAGQSTFDDGQQLPSTQATCNINKLLERQSTFLCQQGLESLQLPCVHALCQVWRGALSNQIFGYKLSGAKVLQACDLTRSIICSFFLFFFLLLFLVLF